MDRVARIIDLEWRAYWRRFVRAGLRGGNQAILFILALVITGKYLQLLTNAAARVSSGNTKLLGSLLTVVFLTWLFPLASNRRDTIASRQWLHLPLTFRERFVVRSVSFLMAPSAWLVVAGSLALCYPLAYSRNPFSGIIAGLLFIATAWLTGLTVAHLLHSAFWRRMLWTALLAGLAVGGTYLLRSGSLRASQISVPFLPTLLVERAAMGTTWDQSAIAVAALATMLVAIGAAALWSFRKSLIVEAQPASEKLVLTSGSFPGRLGGLVAKDFRYFCRLLDIYLGVAAAILAGFYLLASESPSTGIFWSFIVIIFLGNAAVAFNSFGLDNRRGIVRYSLLPISGRSVLLAKNIAYALILLVQVLPLLVIAGWRLGLQASSLGLVEAATLGCAFLTWGNWMSVNHPLKMQFYRFANSGAALVDAMGGIIFGSLPGIALIYLWQRPGRMVVGMTALVVLLTGTLYLLSLRRSGGRFETKKEQIAKALG